MLANVADVDGDVTSLDLESVPITSTTTGLNKTEAIYFGESTRQDLEEGFG